MKTLKIKPPEGYEIDKDKSTFEKIVFKPIKKKLPKSWEELGKIDGFWVETNCDICDGKGFECTGSQKNIFVTEGQAKASIALAQLSQLREVYRDGWEPQWDMYSDKKYIIKKITKGIFNTYVINTPNFLAFQSSEIRDEFLENFRDLIEEASPLLFG